MSCIIIQVHWDRFTTKEEAVAFLQYLRSDAFRGVVPAGLRWISEITPDADLWEAPQSGSKLCSLEYVLLAKACRDAAARFPSLDAEIRGEIDTGNEPFDRTASFRILIIGGNVFESCTRDL